MRIIVFSDSHGNESAMRSVVDLHYNETDLFLHLGDGQRDFEKLTQRYPDKEMLGVRGNCDLGSQGKIADMIVCMEKQIFFTHGHVFNVKRELDTLIKNARGIRSDIVLFGHTHLAMCEYRDGLYLLNPGSIGTSGVVRPTYGIIDITDAGIAPHIVDY